VGHATFLDRQRVQPTTSTGPNVHGPCRVRARPQWPGLCRPECPAVLYTPRILDRDAPERHGASSSLRLLFLAFFLSSTPQGYKLVPTRIQCLSRDKRHSATCMGALLLAIPLWSCQVPSACCSIPVDLLVSLGNMLSTALVDLETQNGLLKSLFLHRRALLALKFYSHRARYLLLVHKTGTIEHYGAWRKEDKEGLELPAIRS
jgi:hypothetical protein